MPVFKSSRKAQVFGSSLALTLPAFFVKANEIMKGNEVSVFYDLDGVLVVSVHKDHDYTIKNLKAIIKKLYEITNLSDKGGLTESI